MRKTIKIKGTEHAVGGQLRAMLIWEAVMDKPFELRLQGDILFYYYCLLAAGDPDFSMGFDEFVAAMEEDVSIVAQFAAAMTAAEKTQEIFDNPGISEKKKTKRSRALRHTDG